MAATERRRAAVLVTVVSNYPSLVDQMTPIEAHRLDRAAPRHGGRRRAGVRRPRQSGDRRRDRLALRRADRPRRRRSAGVRAALELHARVRALDGADGPSGVRLSVQSGLHVGPVVARRLHEGPRRYDIVGAPATLAARLAALADPDESAGQPGDAAARRALHAHGRVRAGGARLAGRSGDAFPGAWGDRNRDAARGVEPDGPDALRRPSVRAVDARNRRSTRAAAVVGSGHRGRRRTRRRKKPAAVRAAGASRERLRACACCRLGAGPTVTAFRMASSCRSCATRSISDRLSASRGCRRREDSRRWTPRSSRSCRSFCTCCR